MSILNQKFAKHLTQFSDELLVQDTRASQGKGGGDDMPTPSRIDNPSAIWSISRKTALG